jgi:hypothetical protein
MPPHARPYDNVLATIGWTSFIWLNRVTDGADALVLAQSPNR